MKINNPMMDAKMDDQTRRYVAILERQNVGLQITINKQKAIIEVLAGQPHEEVLKDMETKEVRDIVAQVIQNKNPELSDREAKAEASKQIANVDGLGGTPASAG